MPARVYDSIFRGYNYIATETVLHGSLTELRNHTCHFHTDRKGVLHMPPLGLDKLLFFLTTQEVSLFGVYQFKESLETIYLWLYCSITENEI